MRALLSAPRRVVLAVAAFAVLAVTLASMYTPRLARANGRFPKAQAITTAPGAPGDTTLFMRASFGIVISHDAGKTWRWLCEQQLGFTSTWDPPIAASKDGRLWIALQDGARVTTDGCVVDDIPSLAGHTVMDLTVDGTGDHVFAVTSEAGKPSFVWRGDAGAKDGGLAAAFTRLGKGVTGFRFDTVEVAPSRASRVYVTGLPEQQGTRAHIFRSDDGGATLTEITPKLATDGRLFVAAVDPHDPDRVLVRQLSEMGSDVLLTTDGGKSFTSVLHMRGAMFGFTRAPDGSAYYAGGGDPKDGIWRSDDRGATWQQGAKTPVFCLHADAARLLVCSNPYLPSGYAVAESRDHGVTIQPLATFDDIGGPVQCDGGAGKSDKCDAPWPELRARIAMSAHVPARSPAEAGAPSDSSSASPSASSSSSSQSPHGGACGCRVCGAPSTPRASSSLLATLLAFAWALRRSRRGSLASQRHAKPDHRHAGMLRRDERAGHSVTHAKV